MNINCRIINFKRTVIETDDLLFRHFEKYIRLTDSLKNELINRVHFKTFKKGTLLHNADNICTTSYFIQKGLLRTYFLKDGREVSEFFSEEGEWINSTRSFIERKQDIYYIDAIENVEVYCLNVDDLVYLFNNYPEMERYSRLSMGTVLGHLMERIVSLRFTTAHDKYVHFRETYNNVYHRIPLGMIASYLGITQETLSRIRAKK